MSTETIPEAILEQQRKAGRARMASLTPAERTALAKLSWTKRLERARKADGLTVTAARTMPQ